LGPWFREKVSQNSRSCQTGFNREDVEDIEFPIAPLPEQRRIVAKLEKLLGQIDACQQRLAKVPTLLKRFRQSVLAAACSGRLTEDWREQHSEIEDVWDYLEKIRKARREAWKAKQEDRKRRLRYPLPTEIDRNGLPDIPESWLWVSADEICSQITDGEHIQP